MRGEERQQRTMLMMLNLEQRIPKEHPLRRIKQLAETVPQGLSPSFDRMYSATGRPSIPPERLLKASLLMALYTVRSERESRGWHPSPRETTGFMAVPLRIAQQKPNSFPLISHALFAKWLCH